jgi:hypothetical protein
VIISSCPGIQSPAPYWQAVQDWVLRSYNEHSTDITAFAGTAVMSVGRSGDGFSASRGGTSAREGTSALEDGGGSADHLGSLPLIVVIR